MTHQQVFWTCPNTKLFREKTVIFVSGSKNFTGTKKKKGWRARLWSDQRISISMAHIDSLILDAGPLLTQTYSDVHGLASKFYTTPSVYNEIKDERARQNLVLWGDNLVVRQPAPKYVQIVSGFSKRTGDYAVLSSTDIQVIALCYELECELNGDGLLRNYPGEIQQGTSRVVTMEKTDERSSTIEHGGELVEDTPEDDGWEVVSVKSKKHRSTQRARIAKPVEKVGEESQTLGNVIQDIQPVDNVVSEKVLNELTDAVNTVEITRKIEQSERKSDQTLQTSTGNEKMSDNVATNAGNEEINNSVEATSEDQVEEIEWDSDEEWITGENLHTELDKNGGDKVELEIDELKSAMSTGDFAMQNVALQIGLHLVNPTNGRQIKTVRNYMLRCHACFKLTGFPKDGRPLQFCPRCGGNTLLRCTVAVSDDGKIKVFLKRNMQWSHRGDKYGLPVPQSRKARRVRHETDPILLREDQKEYQKAVKDSMWKKRHNEKLLDEWIGTGSADSVGTPFAISGYKRDATRHTGVRVGKGRYVNSKKNN
jgi:RNA-binding protein NOB1